MSPADRKEYNAYRNESLKERDYIVSAEEKGIEIGKAEGKAEGIEIGEARLREEKNMIARAMLLDGDSVEKIARITGLSVEKINELKS